MERWDGIYSPIFTATKHLSDRVRGPQLVKVGACQGIRFKMPVISAAGSRAATTETSRAEPDVAARSCWGALFSQTGFVVIIRGDI